MRSGQGRSGHAGTRPLEKGTGRAAHAAESRSVGAVRPGPGPREQAHNSKSLCLAQRSGRPVPRRPLRALLSLSMPQVLRAAQSARFPLATPLAAAPNRAWIPGQSREGRREPARESDEPASQLASQRPASPASLAPQPYSQCAAGAAVLKGPVCSLCANPGGGWGRYLTRGFSVAGVGCGVQAGG